MSAFPLATEQRSMLFLEGIFGPGIFHNIVFGAEVPAGVSNRRVAESVKALADRHDVLRSRSVGTSPFLQVIGAEHPPLALLDTDGEDPLDAFARRRSEVRNVEIRPHRAAFELIGVDPGATRYLLCVLQHLISDGYAVPVLTADLAALLAGRDLPPVPGYAEVQQAAADEQAAARELAYWRSALGGTQPLAGLMPRRADRSGYRRTQIDHDLAGGESWQALSALMQELKATPFSVVGALAAVAVWRWSGRREFLLHTPISNRRDAAARSIGGNFALDRPVPFRVDPDEPLSALVRRTLAASWNALRHARLGIPELVCGVPEYAVSLAGDETDYIQLHVDVQSQEAARVTSSPAGSTGPVDLGPFEPAHDLTVTTLRFQFGESRLFTRSFFGGPPSGADRAEGLLADTMSLLRAAESGDVAIGALSDTAPLN